MRLVRGTNVYPRAGRSKPSCGSTTTIDEFQIHLFTAEGIRDEIEILVEIPDPRSDTDRILSELGTAVWRKRTRACASVSGARRLAALPRFELKAKRLTDDREVWGGKGERKAM